MKSVIKWTIIIVVLLTSGFITGKITAEQAEPEVVTQVEYYPVTRYVAQTEYVDRVEYIDRIVEVYGEPKPFKSWAELSKWQALNYIKDCASNGCTDCALEMQRHALNDGYLMSTEVVGQQGNLHMICSTIIGNQTIFVDPQGTLSWVGGVKGVPD